MLIDDDVSVTAYCRVVLVEKGTLVEDIVVEDGTKTRLTALTVYASSCS